MSAAEERRLFYVGMTRARERLVLCRAHRRRWRGCIEERQPSPFLQDIEERLLERQRGLGVAMADSLVAGIVLERRARLLTRNRRHFARIEGVTLA